jgi:ribonuclease HII
LSPPTLERERALWAEGKHFVAGLDEVGRGPLAGPVVASAVIFPPGQTAIVGLDDSKKMTALQRERLSLVITRKALCWTIAAASAKEVDRFNIRKASALAMRRCLERLPVAPDHVLLDGNDLPEVGWIHESIIKGDSISQSIAAASVLAKVLRDHLMGLLDARHGGFGWCTNMGYGSRKHMEALNRRGPTKHHRLSFSPVSQMNLFER